MLPEHIKQRCNDIHGNVYCYSQFVYTNMNTKSTIVCQTHGRFEQSMSTHLYKKSGCRQCSENYKVINRTGKFSRWNTERFVNRANEIHNNKYNYLTTQYVNAHTPIEITCDVHGPWWTTPALHLWGNKSLGIGCPSCSSKMSAPERFIFSILTETGVNFKYQHTYKELRSSKNRPLVFDFFLPDLNILIEYDGQHHTDRHSLFGANLSRIQELDRIKTNYAKLHSIELIRIPHTMNKQQIRNTLLQQVHDR